MSTVPAARSATAEVGGASPDAIHQLPTAVADPQQQLDGPLHVECIEGWPDAAAVAQWDDLAANAIEPNVFYESWNVAAALETVAAQQRPWFVLIRRESTRQDVPPQLVGLIPLVDGRCHRLRQPAWQTWSHPFVFLQTPLFRTGHAAEALHAWLDWTVRQADRPAVLECPLLSGDGPLAQACVEVFAARKTLTLAVETYTRAMLRRSTDWRVYAARAMSNHQRRELRRLSRRLAESGDFELCVFDSHELDQLPQWREDFLALEARSWKGREQTALASSPESRAYFEKLLDAAAARGRLQMMALRLNGEPLAMKVNLLAGTGAFGFKIAYDERFAKHSPGVQLELENLRLLHEDLDLEWMDSCAVADHSMINRIWQERRTIQHLLISTGGLRGNLTVGLLPLFRAVRRSLQRRP